MHNSNAFLTSTATSMFIKAHLSPTIEFNPGDGQGTPTLVHFLSDRADPFKTVLPQLIEGVGQEVERSLVVESPLSGIVDWTIELHRHPEFPDQVVVDEKDRAFFEAVKASLAQAMAKIDGIQYVALDDENEDC